MMVGDYLVIYLALFGTVVVYGIGRSFRGRREPVAAQSIVVHAGGPYREPPACCATCGQPVTDPIHHYGAGEKSVPR